MGSSGNKPDAAGTRTSRTALPRPDGLPHALNAPPGDPVSPVVVAVSGGLDSTALLAAGVEALGAARLVAVHVDHGLQTESAAWAEHCRRMAETLGVRFAQRRLRAPQRFPDGVEAWARQARYDVLFSVASETGARTIALGHHRDDQIETVLLSLARGAGPAGAAGMRPVSPRGGFLLWRPLLGLPREQLLAFARDRGLQWLEDPSNGDPRLRRNAVRHRLLPLLEAELPGFGANLLRHAGLCGELDELARAMTGRAAPGSGSAGGDGGEGPGTVAAARQRVAAGRPRLDRGFLRSRTPAEQALHLRQWLRDAGLRMPSLAVMTEMRRQLLVSDAAYGRVEFDGWCVRRYRDRIELVRSDGHRGGTDSAHTRRDEGVPWRWAGERRVELPAFEGALIIEPASGQRGLSGARLANEPLRIRPFSGRARIRPRVGGPSRRLKLLSQERGLAAWERRALPVLVDAAGVVVHVPGLASDGAWLTDREEERPLDVRFEPL